ncbi:MAG: serine/threonine protein kinase, partial [Deltaproteobacteria bacterium]|nr:serine/threonine protein kinase [Deltaproteobacteria bacterium]
MEHDLGDTGQQTRSEHDIPDDERGGLELTESPRRIGRFSVLRRVGRGGMGDVYSALDARLGRQVAVKLLKKQPRDQKGRRSRMLREAKAMARVTHPHVVQVYEIGDFNGRVFITMELVEGHTLEHWQKIRVRTHQEVLDAYRQAGEGLAAAHRASVLHRDFKPGNVLIDERGWVRVTDFGLAAWISAASSYVTAEQGIDGTFEGSDDAEPRLTRAGARLGTPAFMSPEQHLGEALDARSDQFSFCVALYEALTGSHPFGGSTRDEVRSAILLGNVRETNHARPLPAWLRPVLLRGLEREPENRWPTM